MSTKFREIVQKHLGPPVNIEAIIRALDIDLDKKAQLHSEIAGQLARLPNGGFKISVNAKDHYYRQRFTMAHELGHYMLHAHLIGSGVDDSKAYRSTPDGEFFNEAITSAEETQANVFASRLLMPKSIILKNAKVGTTIKELSTLLQASEQAVRIRLDGLGYGLTDTEIVSVPPSE